MTAVNNDGNIIKRTSQYIDNIGFDETTGLLTIQIGGTDGVTTNRLKINSDGSLNVNGSFSSSPAKVTDAYGIQAISDDGTYKYFFFEADNADYYILRKTLATNVFKYTKGTGGYAAVYQSSILGPSGSPTWADRGATF